MTQTSDSVFKVMEPQNTLASLARKGSADRGAQDTLHGNSILPAL